MNPTPTYTQDLTLPKHVWLDHSIVGATALTNFHFDKNLPYTFCRICGRIYQGPNASEWRKRHNRSHPDREHLSLAASGRFLTPEAAHTLAPYGIVPITGLDHDTCAALSEAPRMPLVTIDTK